MNNELENLLEDLDSGEVVKIKYGECYAYSPDVVEELKQALLEFKRLDLSLRLPSEQSSSHFTYKDKNLVCMQLTKYSKLMNAFLEYEKVQELEKENAEYKEALKIIFEKQVDISLLNSVGSYINYNEAYLRIKGFTFSKGKLLTETEFETLKEGLK